jgi:anti-anti-sigma factor
VVGATDAARPADCEDPDAMASESAHRDAEVEPDRLEIQSVPRPDGAELRVSGELTHGTATELTDALVEAERSGPGLLVLDLRDIRFADSTGLGALVAAHNRSRRHARRLIVVVADGPIERLLSLTGLAGRLETTSEPPTLG